MTKLPRFKLHRIGQFAPSTRDAMRFYIKPALSEESKEQAKLFNQIGAGFEGAKPVITRGKHEKSGGSMQIVTGALAATEGNQKLSWANYGTGERVMVPRRARVLRFMLGYKPATRPGSIVGGTKSRSEPIVFARSTRNAIEPRDFDLEIADMREEAWPELFKEWIHYYARTFWRSVN